jgi:hypothetical protein
VSNGNRTKHYRTLAGHLRLWAEGANSSDVTEELYSIATRLDQLASRLETRLGLDGNRSDQAESLAT